MATHLPVIPVATMLVAGGVVFLDGNGHAIAHAGQPQDVLHRAILGWSVWRNDDGELIATKNLQPEQLPIPPRGWHRLSVTDMLLS